MKLTLHDHLAYAYTGGKSWKQGQAGVVFVHGALHDHSVWILQSRYLAHHGWNVLALDLPGHCRSAGDAPSTVEEAADFIGGVLDAVGVVRRVGGYGNGYVAKLVNNQLWFVHAAAIGEAMVTAKKAGLDPDVWWEAMKGGAADSFVMQHDVPSILAGHYDPSFRLALCLKDLALVDDLLTDTGVRHEITAATYDRFREAASRYGAGAGERTVCKALEDDAGIDLRVHGDWTPPWEVKHPSEH